VTGRRRANRLPATPVGGPIVLDWSGPGHWSRDAKPCRYCGEPTNLRDSKGKPAHKVHAEQALAQQIAEQADAYHNEGHLS
jgi:hypothetical protein